MYHYFSSPDYLKDAIKHIAVDECVGFLKNYPTTVSKLRNRLEQCGCSAIQIDENDRSLEVTCTLTLRPAPLNPLRTDVKCGMHFELPLNNSSAYDLPTVQKISVKSKEIDRYQPFDVIEKLYDNNPRAFQLENYLNTDDELEIYF